MNSEVGCSQQGQCKQILRLGQAQGEVLDGSSIPNAHSVTTQKKEGVALLTGSAHTCLEARGSPMTGFTNSIPIPVAFLSDAPLCNSEL